jgi:hypothetical protein
MKGVMMLQQKPPAENYRPSTVWERIYGPQPRSPVDNTAQGFTQGKPPNSNIIDMLEALRRHSSS